MSVLLRGTVILWLSATTCWASGYSVGLTSHPLSPREVAPLDPLELHLLRNEVYARRGHKFQKPYLKEYFDLNWESVKHSTTTPPDELTEWDRSNLALIAQAEPSSRKRTEESAKHVSVGYELEPSWPEVTSKWHQCFWGELVIGQPQLICINFAPAAEFWMPIVSINWNFFGLDADFVVRRIRLIDINPADKFRELVVTGSGFKSFETWIFGYDGKKLAVMERFFGDGHLDETGHLKLLSVKMSSFLQAWGYEEKYRLDEQHRIVPIPQALYPIGNTVALKVALPLQRSRTDDSTITTLQPGENVTLVSTDNKEWCLVRSSVGVEGWVAVTPDNKVRRLNLNAHEVFDGLQVGE